MNFNGCFRVASFPSRMVEIVLRKLPLILLIVSSAAVERVPGAIFEFGQTGTDAASFFSGTVVENSSSQITVARTIQGRSPERRTFIINSGTTIEGHLKDKSRVTVRFASGENGDVALSIIVRDSRTEKRRGSGRPGPPPGSPAFLHHLPRTT